MRGIQAYRRLFDALRLTRHTAVADADLSYDLSLPTETTIRVRWHARLWLRMPLLSFVGVRGGAQPLLVDGVSLYELDADARTSACQSAGARAHAAAMRSPDFLGVCWTVRVMRRRACSQVYHLSPRRRRAGRCCVRRASAT